MRDATWQMIRAALALGALIALAYGAGVRNELVFDERMFVERDERVQEFAVGRIFLEALWSEGEKDERVHQYYRPLQLLPLALSYRWFGAAGWPSHLLSMAVHLANCLLVLSIFRTLLAASGSRRDDDVVQLALVGLYAVHPGLSEAVFWISDIAGLGAAFCILASFRLHLSPRRDRWYGRAGAPLLLLAGLWFKESGILILPLLALYDLVAAPDRGIARLHAMRLRYLVLLPALLVYGGMRLHALGGALPGMSAVPLSTGQMWLNAIALLPEFGATFLWPFDPNMFHDFEPVTGLASPKLMAGAAMGVAAVAVVAANIRRNRVVAFAVLWTLTCAAPHLLVRWPQLNVFAERYLYLPAVGVFLLIGATLAGPAWTQAARRLPVRLAYFAVLIAFVVTNVQRASDWRDDVTIYEKTLRQSARAELIRTNLAIRYLEDGRYDEGIELLRELLAINPDWPETRHNLGLLYMANEQPMRARRAFEEARRLDPFNGSTLLNLGYLYDHAGRRTEAVERYLELVRREPANDAGWYNLAVIAREEGQLANAKHAVDRVLALVPQDAAARTLAARIDRSERRTVVRAETRRVCREARRLFREQRLREAVLKLRAAAWLDETSPLPHHFLANIYFLTGRRAEGLEYARAALQRAPENQLYQRNVAALERGADPLAEESPE